MTSKLGPPGRKNPCDQSHAILYVQDLTWNLSLCVSIQLLKKNINSMYNYSSYQEQSQTIVNPPSSLP